MGKKLGLIPVLIVAALYALPAVALPTQANSASISGFVRDHAGKPQMGAVVEIFTSALSVPLKAFTDDKGHYAVEDVQPGTYYVKASANYFLPSLRENVSLSPGARAVVNLTLNTLLEAVELLPARRNPEQDSDDWRWTLRSAGNRPILRVLDDGPLVVVSRSDDENDRVLKARVAFIAGSDGDFGGAGMKTSFSLEQSLFTTGLVELRGNVGHSDGGTGGMVRASYKQELPNGAHPEVALTVRRFATENTAMQSAALNALALSLTNGFNLGDFLEFNYGGELQSVQYHGSVTAFRPFGSVAAHLSPDTVVEYRYATSQPTTRSDKGFATAPADLSETNPRMSLQRGVTRLERARHQEVSLSHRIGASNFQAAYFSDRLRNIALTGVGETDSDFGDFLGDIYSNTFTYTGGELETRGLRLVAQRRISDALTATMNYSFGGVFAVDAPNTALQASAFQMHRRHAMTAKFSGRAPRTKTFWIASYKWTSGAGTLTPVDSFNASAGQADPYLSIFVRQPLPGSSFLPGKIEALVDVRNLLSQGYVPMFGADGRTLYLVQSARSVRGGLAFNF